MPMVPRTLKEESSETAPLEGYLQKTQKCRGDGSHRNDPRNDRVVREWSRIEEYMESEEEKQTK